MREKTDFPQNNNVQLCPELLRKISKNETLEELIITGEVDYGFFGDNTDLFQDAIIGAFLKNQVTKIVVLDAVSLEAINLLLPVLSNIPHLKIRNLCFNRITHLCNELSKSFPKAPVIELYDEVMDKESYHQIDSFNRRDKKRGLETDSEIEDSNKKRRVDSDMVVEDFNIALSNQAIVQNTDASLVLSKDTIDLSEEEVKAFEQIRQVYLNSVRPYVLYPVVGKYSKNLELKKEFLDLPNKNKCPNYKKFIPMLSKKTSVISDLKDHVLLSAVDQGNREVVNFLLGARVRMVFDEPTAENKKAVLAEYELLIIKKPSEKLTYLEKQTANLLFLGFKNNQGKYEERPIIRKIKLFRESLICRDAAVVKYVIQSAEKFNASQNFFYACYLGENTIKSMIVLALEKGHLQILYDVIEYDNLPVAEKNNFSSMINYLGEIAVKNELTILLNYLFTFQKELNIKPLINYAIKSKQFKSVDLFFGCCLLSDEDIESYLRYTDSLDILQYFFDSNKNYFYSIANKSLDYAVQVIYEQNALPEQKGKVIKDAGRSVILLVSSDKKFTIGFNFYGKYYTEYRLSEETHEELMRAITNSIKDDSNVVNTSGWLTRYLRSLLLFFSAYTPVQFDPVKLAAIVCSSHGSAFLGELSTLRDNPLDLVNLLLKNKYYDLSINDNQFLKQLAEIFNTCNQIVNKSSEDQRKINSIGLMIVSLLSDSRINPVLKGENLDDYVRGIQLSIKNGYHTVLPILLKYKPEQSPMLYEIFLNHTQMMNIALEICKDSHFEIIIPILLRELSFYHLLDTESALREKCIVQHDYILTQYDTIMSNKMNYTPGYLDKKLGEMNEERKLISAKLAVINNKLREIDQNNLSILKAVLSSPRVFHLKNVEEWNNFLTSRNREIHCPSFLTYLKEWKWEKIKPWREVKANPNQFFTHGLFVPNDIFDKITVSYCDVISKR